MAQSLFEIFVHSQQEPDRLWGSHALEDEGKLRFKNEKGEDVGVFQTRRSQALLTFA